MKFYQLLSIVLITLIVGCKSQYPDLDEGLYADIVTNKGSIVLKLESEKTPITVANFVSLSEGDNPIVSEEFKGKKYYDNILFHRVINDFMIQGGDPTASGSGGPGYSFDDEITDLTHDGPGILSMANSGPATNGSQFFITHKETPWLDGKHTVFGRVVQGQNVVDSIAKNDTINTIKIIRKGGDAKKFDAPKIFKEYYAEKEQVAMEREERLADVRLKNTAMFDELRKKATLTSSGLEYVITEKGTGAPVSTTYLANANYAVYFVDGTLLDTSMLGVAEANDMVNIARKDANAYQPIKCDVRPDGQMIAGFKEGLQLLNVGDKATLFLPYTLAYGAEGTGPIPPQSDLIFNVEIVELVQE